MKTLTNILFLVVLAMIVGMTAWQEQDIIDLKLRAYNVENGLVAAAGWCQKVQGRLTDLEGGLTSIEGGLTSVEGGLASVKGGLDPAKGGLTIDDIMGASVRIVIGAGMRMTAGTGVFVSETVILTAKHVATAGNIRSITNGRGKTFTVVEVRKDANDDLAIIIVAERNEFWLETGPRPALDDSIISIGSPFVGINTYFTTARGSVSTEKWCNGKFFFHGLAIPGCSGGPVIAHGTVVGIVIQKHFDTGSLGLALPIERLDLDLRALF